MLEQFSHWGIWEGVRSHDVHVTISRAHLGCCIAHCGSCIADFLGLLLYRRSQLVRCLGRLGLHIVSCLRGQS